MDFDTELMVRLYWRGVPVHHVPTEVTYPENNTSNFRMWKDNVLISWMHTRLFFGMLARLPGFIARGGHFGQKHRTGIDPENIPKPSEPPPNTGRKLTNAAFTGASGSLAWFIVMAGVGCVWW